MSMVLCTAQPYPALVVTGPRPSGKTTLTQAVFPDKPYVSLEDLDIREFAISDPRGFLNRYRQGAILDVVQRAPDLFCYLQTRLDAEKTMGLFILTGSQQFGQSSGISQSFAGRAAKVSLLPFSYYELYCAEKAPQRLRICYSTACIRLFMTVACRLLFGITTMLIPILNVMIANSFVFVILVPFSVLSVCAPRLPDNY